MQQEKADSQRVLTVDGTSNFPFKKTKTAQSGFHECLTPDENQIIIRNIMRIKLASFKASLLNKENKRHINTMRLILRQCCGHRNKGSKT